ncbi:MAG: hypothetical protein IK107_04380, partial [Oscillospiraceae bacterium]|nr:hypothetical protein [Oscillospiraceae bacterium]
YQLLKRFEELSGGRVYDTGKISDLPQCFDEIIGEVCMLPFDENNRTEIKGDGGEHEKVIHVPPCVAEATIRISCGQLNVIRDGKLQLYNEKGENVALTTGVNVSSENQDVWFTLDDLGATIKLREPKKGDWKIRVSDMISDKDIRETWIMQYNMSVDFDQNTVQDAYIGEPYTVKVILKSDGNLVTDPEVYRTEQDENGFSLHANLICSDGTALPADFGNPKSDEMLDKLTKLPGAKSIPLKQANPSDAFFTAEVPMEAAGSHLLSVWIDSAYFYCYVDKAVNIGEAIPEAVSVPAFVVENGSTLEMPPMSDADAANYPTWSIVSASDEIAEVVQNGNNLKVTGKKPGSGEIRLHFDAASGPAPEDTIVPLTVTNAEPVISLEGSITLNKGETFELGGLSAKVKDVENDPLTISLGSAGDSKIISAAVDNDTLRITGSGEGSTQITLEVFDGSNTASKDISVEVKLTAADRVLKWLPFIIGALVLLIVIIILCAIAAKKKRRLFITLKRAVYVECSETGAKIKDMTIAADLKVNARLDCGEIKLGALLKKLAGFSMDSAVQQLAVAGSSHRFEETCGIADAVNCIGGKNEADGVRFTGRSNSLMADNQGIGEKIESHLRNDPGSGIG